MTLFSNMWMFLDYKVSIELYTALGHMFLILSGSKLVNTCCEDKKCNNLDFVTSYQAASVWNCVCVMW